MVSFGDAIQKAARIFLMALLPEGMEALLIRDIYGVLSIALNITRSDHLETVERLEREIAALGPYAGSPGVVCADDLFDAALIFKDPSIVQFMAPGTDAPVPMLERQVTGQDWLRNGEEAPRSISQVSIPRMVFFGLKGGVGRSTALAVLAYFLAKAGKQVLLIDLDLESPGLSGLLLPPDKLSDFGVVDWLVEDANGQGPEVLQQMVVSSPLSDNLRHEIRVAPAIGRNDVCYLDKLSRVYADVSDGIHPERFSERVHRMVRDLEEKEKPDVVLIDSRAGLHDLAALSIVGLASTAFCFATDSSQGWQGYRSLFVHWQSRPEVARKIRERLKMVCALMPESDQLVRSRRFIERSYDLFAETLYDEVIPQERNQDLFNFDIEDSSAPHFPFRIRWSSRFQEFDPLQIPMGLFGEDEIKAAYGEFLDGVMQLLEEASPK